MMYPHNELHELQNKLNALYDTLDFEYAEYLEEQTLLEIRETKCKIKDLLDDYVETLD